MELAEIFGGQIDFDSELQPGDSFEVLFEKSSRDGEFAGYGAILGARSWSTARTHQAFRWVDSDDGQGGLLRRGGTIAETVLPDVAAQVRAARHLRLLAPPAASRAPHVMRAHLGVDYARAARSGGRRGRRRHGRVGRLGGCRRQPGPAFATPAASRPTICTCRPSPRASVPARSVDRDR